MEAFEVQESVDRCRVRGYSAMLKVMQESYPADESITLKKAGIKRFRWYTLEIIAEGEQFAQYDSDSIPL